MAMPTAMPEPPLTSRFGIGGRQDGRLLLLAVIVGYEVDDVLVEGLREQPGTGGQPALGVAHGRRRVVVAERAEVAVPVDHRQPHRERLGHPDEGVVDRRVTVRVQLAHDLADDSGALDVAAVRAQAHLAHLEQDAAMDRLETVAGVRQGAGVDHRVGVLEEALGELRRDVDVDDVLVGDGRGRRRGARGHGLHTARRRRPAGPVAASVDSVSSALAAEGGVRLVSCRYGSVRCRALPRDPDQSRQPGLDHRRCLTAPGPPPNPKDRLLLSATA